MTLRLIGARKMDRAQTTNNNYILATICLIQAVGLLTALVELNTSPADETAKQVITRVEQLISNAKELMGITRKEGED